MTRYPSKKSALSVSKGVAQPDAVSNEAVSRLKKAIKGKPSASLLFEGIRSANISSLGRAITLVESSHPKHQSEAQKLISLCLPFSGKALRVGITGVPGAGKSTFIEALGKHIISSGGKLAVLAVDPSSERSKGSILGDKTRMEELAGSSEAFIRPSPSGGTLGGVARKTRETIILCEAAGFDTIFVETVGVGQSETAVHSMVDFFLLIMIAGAGDELQGIKRGIMEMADAVIVNKADGEQLQAAGQAASDIRSALRLTPRNKDDLEISVLTASALTGQGVNYAWDHIEERIRVKRESGEFKNRRDDQRRDWFENAVEYLLRSQITADQSLSDLKRDLISEVYSGKRHPVSAASALVDAIRGKS